MTTPDEPSVDLVQLAAGQARRIARTTERVALVGVLVAGAGLAVAGVASLPTTGLVLAGIGVGTVALYGVAWRRASTSLSHILHGPYRRVRAVGWCRPPDGCNYALFFESDAVLPDAVVRLPIRRDMKDATESWVAGPLVPSLLGAAAVFDGTGLLATGRIVARPTGLRRWERRNTAPSPLVRRPPRNWLPPGGR